MGMGEHKHVYGTKHLCWNSPLVLLLQIDKFSPYVTIGVDRRTLIIVVFSLTPPVLQLMMVAGVCPRPPPPPPTLTSPHVADDGFYPPSPHTLFPFSTCHSWWWMMDLNPPTPTAPFSTFRSWWWMMNSNPCHTHSPFSACCSGWSI